MDLNKKSVNQQGGAMIPNQPGMQQQPQVDPQVMQISEIFSRSMEEGRQPQEVLIGLMEQEVDQNLIGQALMQLGYEEEAIIQLFEEVQNLQEPQAPSSQQITNNPEQLARAEEMQQQASPMDMNITPIDQAKSGIEIKPENKGKFTRWAKARDMSVSEAYNKVMSNTDNYPASVVKMANFAKNAAGWKKEEGGEQKAFEPHFMYKGKRKIRAKDMETHLRLKEAGYTHDEPKAQYGGYISPDPIRINPALFSNQKIDYGKFINVGSEIYNDFFSKSDKNKDNLADGVFRDMGKKKEMNDRRSLKFDLSSENINAYKAYKDKLEEEKKLKQATLTPYEQRLNDLPKGQYGIPFLSDEYNNYNNLVSGILNPMSRNDSNQVYIDTILQDRMRQGNPDEQTSDELAELVNFPTLKSDRSFMDRVNNIPNTNAAAIYGAGSNAAVKIAGLANEIFDYNKYNDARKDLRTDVIADNLYGTFTDMNFKRGKGPDINTGIFGSEGDRTTGLYMSKEGGGVNNAGFKALPDYVQSNILSNMAYGGPKGAEAYLANKDRAIKRSMGRAQQGGETIEVDSKMLAKLIAAGADIEKL
tara:strand:+ start:1664 stop:3424 length:1761 start_codon:yes stop_codon:yes gene_type:complete